MSVGATLPQEKLIPEEGQDNQDDLVGEHGFDLCRGTLLAEALTEIAESEHPLESSIHHLPIKIFKGI